MSCAVFTGIGVYASWRGKTNHWVVTAIVIAGLALFYVAAFRAWSEEHKKLEAEVAKRGRPELTAEFVVAGSPPKTVLVLHNSSNVPAVNFVIEEIRSGTRVLQFSVPKPVRAGPGTWVDSWILEDGRHHANDVMALFSGMKFVGQKSPTFILRIAYSCPDSRESARNWILSSNFWYDRVTEKICMAQQQYIDPF